LRLCDARNPSVAFLSPSLAAFAVKKGLRLLGR
jgi:hypothetical protein